jgi:hypothetical protein
MEFIAGCLLFGVAFVVLSSVASGVFLDVKKRRDQKDGRTESWKVDPY